MARQDHLQTNFSGGEISPRLYGRPDLAKYADSVKEARDVIFLQHGGVRGRPGTDYCGEVKDSADETRLIPFVYSRDDAYVIEAGDAYFRFWKNGEVIGGGTPYEVTTPYTTATVFDVDYTQGADTMFLALASQPINRLQRYSNTRWVLAPAPFDPAPFAEVGMRPATTLTLGSASVGATTATAGAGTFLAADVGRRISSAGGVATITGYTSATVVDASVVVAFAGTGLASGAWLLEGTPQTQCTPSAATPLGASTTLTLVGDGWRAADVGKFVEINGGLVKITGYTDALNVTGTIVRVLTGTTAAPADSWVLNGAAWNATDGYPETVTLHEQRLVAGNTARYPQTIWGSRAGIYLDFLLGTVDDEAYSFELSSDEINPIQYLDSGRTLVALTYGAEWILTGGIEKPITPTNIRAVAQSKVGAARVRPELVDNDLFYVQRGLSALRSLSYRPEFGGYDNEETSTFAEHLARGGIKQIAFQQSPERVMWVLKDDGSLLAVTVSRAQNVRPFSKCLAAGGVDSIAIIPEGDEDKLYMVIQRTVDGQTKRYVERMRWDCYQDSTITLSPGSATVTGLDHLEGLTVAAVADGIDIGDFTVTGGEIELPRSADEVSIGVRFTPSITLLQPEIGTGMGASSGRATMTGQTRVLFSETIGCNVNGSAVLTRQFDVDTWDSAPEPFTGWKDISGVGWAKDSGEITLSQPQAYPWCVLSVVRRMTANPG